jgi:site-specific recombinase XerD
MQGVGPIALAALLGHKSLAMVLRYSHLAPKHLADAVSRLVSFGTSTKTDTASAVSS